MWVKLRKIKTSGICIFAHVYTLEMGAIIFGGTRFHAQIKKLHGVTTFYMYCMYIYLQTVNRNFYYP